MHTYVIVAPRPVPSTFIKRSTPGNLGGEEGSLVAARPTTQPTSMDMAGPTKKQAGCYRFRKTFPQQILNNLFYF